MYNKYTKQTKFRFYNVNSEKMEKKDEEVKGKKTINSRNENDLKQCQTISEMKTSESVLNTALSTKQTTLVKNTPLLIKSRSTTSLNSPAQVAGRNCMNLVNTTPILTSKTKRSPCTKIKPANRTPIQLRTRRNANISEQMTTECFPIGTLDSPKNNSKIGNIELCVDDTLKTKDGELSNLTVAVRVRPMNSKELLKPAILNIIQVEDDQIIVSTGKTADNSAGVIHRFQYDHAYWSCNINHSIYASQDDVFKGTALPLIDKAFQGYNACLFAYGQTGSGKSYSMMGIDIEDHDKIDEKSEAGIIPRFCQELFRRVDCIKDTYHAEIEVSYFEIYNEKIHDLLAVSIENGLINTTSNNKIHTALRVREHPIWGPYVVDLSTHPVDSHSAIRNWLAVGNSQRATAATGMNDKSSRSHSIFNIVLNLSEVNATENNQSKRSKISLVDLAGSERVHTSYTCATGERLREGVSINKSLLTLGKVIAALSDSKRNTNFVPYRESVLTWLLRENLGGNSRTVMLATISPANIHLDETLATLRYACQARSIVNRVKVNEDPHDRIIRELRAEVERLQVLQQEYERHKRYSSNSPPLPRKIIIETSADENEIDVLRQQLIETEQELIKAEKSWIERLKEADNLRKTEMKLLKRKGLALELSIEQKQPCLVNLAADPSLSGTLLYLIPQGIVKIGKSRPSTFDQPEIILEGPLVAYHHCSIQNTNGKLFLIPQNKDSFETFVNGELVTIKRQLLHGDRLVIGGSHYFRVANPNCPNKTNNMIVDFQTAYQEILDEQEKRLRDELNREKQEAFSAIEAERQRNDEIYHEKMERLELEQFKHNCSKELLETEKIALFTEQNKKNINFCDFKPFKSTVLDEIAMILIDKTKDSLHNINIMVKEASQRCRDMGVLYEFQLSHVANELGEFRNVVKILDHSNFRAAEWSPTRLEVWLDQLRESDGVININCIFDGIDIEWKNFDQDADEYTQNESLNSSRIAVNMDAMKGVILGGNNKVTNTLPKASSYSYNFTNSISKVQKNLCGSNLHSQLNSLKEFNRTARKLVSEIHNSTMNLKFLLELSKRSNNSERINPGLLSNVQDLENIIENIKINL